MIDRAERGDRAVILHPEFRLTGPDALDEFQELARSAGAEDVGVVMAPRAEPETRDILGSDELQDQQELAGAAGAVGGMGAVGGSASCVGGTTSSSGGGVVGAS